MVFREEPRKQKPRSCRAQEFGRSSAQEKQWLDKRRIELSASGSECRAVELQESEEI
jgi:hypothetical protein